MRQIVPGVPELLFNLQTNKQRFQLYIQRSHIILDYLQALTPKYACTTREREHFLHANCILAVYNFSKVFILFYFTDLSRKSKFKAIDDLI